MVSQNSTPGSADFQALCTIFFQSSDASISFEYRGFFESMGYCWVYFSPAMAAFMKSSSILTDTLAPVTLPLVILASMKDSESGCFMDTLSIRAPRRPSCATSRVEFEKRSMKGTSPVDVSAEFFTGEPLGRISERSWPTPPRRFISCTCSSSIFIMAP